ncbi:unnamed protein product [Amoebophrya sp. A25]|nr:unnamed protein product [Amoebophrya sp. A25]|eukprot:GSA25T00011349001.1
MLLYRAARTTRKWMFLFGLLFSLQIFCPAASEQATEGDDETTFEDAGLRIQDVVASPQSHSSSGNGDGPLEETKWFLVPFPENMQQIRGIALPCEYFGHMYSFEVSFAAFIRDNVFLRADSADEAEFVLLPHCITMVYHALRYQMGFNTRRKTWEALHIAQAEYLLPLISWTRAQPWFERNRHKMVVPYAMDKGRVDYPLASEATQDWHAVTTVGSRTWLRDRVVHVTLRSGNGIGREKVMHSGPRARGLEEEEAINVSPVGTFSGYEEPITETDDIEASSDRVGDVPGHGDDSSKNFDAESLAAVIEEEVHMEKDAEKEENADNEEATPSPPNKAALSKENEEDDQNSEAYWNSAKWIDPVFHYDKEKAVFGFLRRERTRQILRLQKNLNAVDELNANVGELDTATSNIKSAPSPLPFDPCWNQTSVSKRAFLWYPQDAIVPVPTAFYFTEEAASTQNRFRLLFYAASVNSCTRRLVSDVAHIFWNDGKSKGGSAAVASDVQNIAQQQEYSDVLVLAGTVDRDTWRGYMYESRYCLVPDGFSSVSARLFEVMMHGCLPVIISDAFHGAFEHSLPWTSFAVFVARRDVTRLPEILRQIPDEEYVRRHQDMRSIHPMLHEEAGQFWTALFKELRIRRMAPVNVE